MPAELEEYSRNGVPSANFGHLNLRPSQGHFYPDLSQSSFSAQVGSLYPLKTSPPHLNHQGISQTPLQSENPNASAAETFQTPLGFHIPDEKLSAARRADNSHDGYWRHSLYQGPRGPKDTVKVHYCKSKQAMETVSQLFANEAVLGFDIEWVAQASAKDEIRRNVSLIQIASESRIALFHVAVFPGASMPEDFVAPSFKRIMESSSITKAGVAIKGDCTRLRNHLGINCQGLFELSHLYKLLRYCTGQEVKMNRLCVNLALQVGEHLGLPLLKNEVQTSDWTRELKYEQTQYAAADSYAGFQLYHRMEAKRLSLEPIPPRPAFAELNQSILVAQAQAPNEELELELEATMLDGVSGESEGSSSNSSDSEVSSDEIASITRDLSSTQLDSPGQSSPHSVTKARGSRASASLAPSPAVPETKAFVPPSKELDLANGWASSYRVGCLGPLQISAACLRVYHLWHHQQYDVNAITTILRNPPLKKETVIGYIRAAVSRGSLPADPERFAKLGADGVEPRELYNTNASQADRDQTDVKESLVSTEIESRDEDIDWWQRIRQTFGIGPR